MASPGRTIASLPVIGSRVDRHDRSELSSSVPRKRRRAFERIYKRHHQELYRYCFSILRSREDAEDALQATMAAALRSLPGEKREIALRPWLFRVAHNESISLLRTRRPTAELQPDSGPAAPSAESQHDERDRLRQLVDDLSSLPERQSAAIVMRELSGLSYEEIGLALSSSEAAARQAVYEGRVALRTLEEGREMECESVRQALSDHDGRSLRARKLKAHLEDCDGCRGFAASIEQRRADLAMLCPPLPALAATGILGGLLGVGAKGSAAAAGAAGAGSAGAGLVGGGLAGSAAIKGASLAAAVVVAAGAADMGGAIDLPNPFNGGGDSPGGRPRAGGPRLRPVVTNEVAAGIETVGQEGGAAAGANGPGAGAHPGKSGDAPGRNGSTPGQSGSTPGQSGATPGRPRRDARSGGRHPRRQRRGPGRRRVRGRLGERLVARTRAAPRPARPPRAPAAATPPTRGPRRRSRLPRRLRLRPCRPSRRTPARRPARCRGFRQVGPDKRGPRRCASS